MTAKGGSFRRGQPLSRFQRQLPFQGSHGRADMPPLKGEVPAVRAEGFQNADLGRSNLWRPMVVTRTGGSKWQSALPTGASSCVQAQPAREIAEKTQFAD